jgi:hypothetical protein
MPSINDREAVARRTELDRAAVKLDGEARAGVQSVELDECVESRRDRIPRRPQRVGDLG